MLVCSAMRCQVYGCEHEAAYPRLPCDACHVDMCEECYKEKEGACCDLCLALTKRNDHGEDIDCSGREIGDENCPECKRLQDAVLRAEAANEGPIR